MIRKLARPMLASVYVADGVDTLLNTQAHVEGTQAVLTKVRTVLPRKYARQIPNDAALVTQAIGGTKIGAGALLAIGKAPRLAAGTLALLSVPTILARHAFWETQDPEEKIARRQGFLTNVALLGGLAITSVDTAGKPGLAWRANHAAKQANKQIQQALPTRSETEKFADNAQESAAAFAVTAKDWFNEASDKVSEYATKAQDYVEDNKDDWIDRAQDLFSDAEKSGSEWLKQAQKSSKVAKKKIVKNAAKAQDRALEAYAQAEKSTGRAAKKASKQASKFQKDADKRIAKAQKKLKNSF